MYDLSWWKCCCKKCERMKRKYLKQKEINDELFRLVNSLKETQDELLKYIEKN